MSADPTSAAWLSAHVYYHGGSAGLDRLIDGAARPLVAELDARGLIEQHFFVRYWQGGPHLRLRLLPRSAHAAAEVGAAIEAGLGAFLRDHPSRTAIAPSDYLAMARPLAGAEAGAEPVEPLAANNSVQRRSYDREYERYGGSLAAMQAAEQQFTASSELAYALIAAGLTRDQRTGQALSAMFVAAAVTQPGADGLAACCRDGRAEWGGDRMLGAPPAALEARYQRQRAQLHDLTGRLAALVADGVAAEAPIARWMSSIRQLVARLRDVVPPAQLDRIVRLCSHMHCNRLGLSLPEEAYLRYLLWRVTDRDRAPAHAERSS